jgi:protein TonB
VISRVPIWAVAVSLAVNFSLLGLISLLSSERKPPQDITDPIAISLVKLEVPEVAPQDQLKEPDKPKPQERSDFQPDLFRPDLSRGQDLFNLGVAISFGGASGGETAEEFVFEAYELDQPPQVVLRVPPVYPYKARERGTEGAVQIKMLVNTDGTVGEVLILEARPRDVFEEAVLKAVPQWKFRPGKIDGEPVTAWVVTTVRFEL